MKIQSITPANSLNKAYRKTSLRRDEVEIFKSGFKRLFNRINEKESEENLKNIVADFFKEVWYRNEYEINTKDRKDLVIHNGKSASDPVGVILEVKRPGNKAEMISSEKPNAKAFHELILYYLRERIDHNNSQIKHLIATNIWDWYIFDGVWFEKNVFRNKKLVNDYEDYKVSGQDTRYFYDEIASKFLDSLADEVPYTFFCLKDYEEIITNLSPEDDIKLLDLYKVFSPEHLLSKSFVNDSNSLNREFYTELLHIIGLGETKDKSKKLIGRKAAGTRDEGSILENAINVLSSRNRLNFLPKSERYGDTEEEKLFSAGLELVITWLNRILFLKLLEGQLISYHKGDKKYAFLNHSVIEDFDQLNELFFDVLAVPEDKRLESVTEKFGHLPYLNSSLFEESELERNGITIAELKDRLELTVHSSTVLKDALGKRITGRKKSLQYLFEFLDAYDFSSDSKAEIQEQNKSLISASVLGLIFEKINGYKDGSYFTPGFITMYMCRETIRRAVVQKFNDAKGWNCEEFGQLYDKIEDKQEANKLINSLKICDPAVGSGHFLVSALNEIISIKSELKILLDRNSKTLRDYQVEVVNDELVITDDDGRFFQYNPRNDESRRVQEALFHEKQTIIENCLFGVDINPKSVMICRLRLWIELLKNAYYITPNPLSNLERGQGVRLETLPNLDINIKCGNSLISRFTLDADLGEALRKSKWNMVSYRNAVQTYRSAETKAQKHAMEKLIGDIKSDFETEVTRNDKRLLKLNRIKGELFNLTTQTALFEQTKAEKAAWEKQVKKLTTEIATIETALEEIKSNRIYENAFEWRFEFPEVLDDEGKFVGFDVVIGNPPYIRQEEIKAFKSYLSENYNLYTGISDLYVFFIEKGFDLLKRDGQFCYIMPNKWMQAGYGKPLRHFFLKKGLHSLIDFGDLQVFDEATTYPCIVNASKVKLSGEFKSIVVKTLNFDLGFEAYIKMVSNEMHYSDLSSETWIISTNAEQKLLLKLKSSCISLSDYIGGNAYRGILTGLSEAFILDEATKDRLIHEDYKSAELLKPFLLGRDIKPYANVKASNWLILIPKGFTIKRNLPKSSTFSWSEPVPRYGSMLYDDAWEWFKENYPAIAAYLSQHKVKAEKRLDQGDFWWELRACDYYSKFSDSKIMYQKFQVRPCFIFDVEGAYCNDSMWIIPTKDKTLLAILNSKIGWWLISKYCTAIQNGYQLIWDYFGRIPIPTQIDHKFSVRIISFVDEIIQIKKSDPHADTSALEAEIDRLVYELYGLTEEERRIVEGG
jgi:hypothetical protein